MVRAQIKGLRRLLSLRPPAVLLWRVARWISGYFVREFAWQLAALNATAIALLAITSLLSGALAIVVAALLGAWLGLAVALGLESARSARAVEGALAELPGEPPESRFPRSHLFFPILMLFARSVRKERGIVYHTEGRVRLRLDIYRPRAHPPAEGPRPAVIQVHGGGWISGTRSEQGIPLLNHLAANGWIGFSIDYRLSPRFALPEPVIDIKRAIAWVRDHAEELGVDPNRIALTGGSAGGHLAALTALTADDRSLQPGFEESDTSVAAAVPFYGVYDMLDEDTIYYESFASWLLERVVVKRSAADDIDFYRSVSPIHRVHEDAPPFLIFHGDRDTLVPVEDARAFAERLRAASRNDVLYVELPGAEHAFDLMPSLRTARVVEGIERFLREAVPTPEDRARDHGALEMVA